MKNNIQFLEKIFPLVATTLVVCGATSHANPLVFEDFDYGLANDANFDNTPITATGLTGNWDVSNANTASTLFQTGGLSFSSNFFATSGGAIKQTTSDTTVTSIGSTITGAALATSHTGTLYGSYLVRFLALNTTDPEGWPVSTQRVNSSITASGTSSWFRADADSGSQSLSGRRKPGVGYGPTTSDYTGSSEVAIDTTYLVVSRFTNVGEALDSGNTGAADLWMFTATDYDLWFNNGANEGLLGTYATFSISATPLTSGTTRTFNNTRFVQFGTASGNHSGAGTSFQTTIFDELRYGSTLGDVMAIPEPNHAGLLACGLGLLTVRSRFRRTGSGS